MPVISDFLKSIDQLWSPSSDGKLELRIIGSAALTLQTSYDRGTKDSDVLETSTLTGEIAARLVELAGPSTDLHRRHGIYVDVVARGLPFLPQSPLFHGLSRLGRELRHFEVKVLDVVDVVVSKLKRFSANDVSDIRAMVERDLVDHARLLERFRSAVDRFSYDARAEDLPRYVKNLNRIERDFLFVPESRIELPDWI